LAGLVDEFQHIIGGIWMLRHVLRLSLAKNKKPPSVLMKVFP
jgi:hypothetical protein